MTLNLKDELPWYKTFAKKLSSISTSRERAPTYSTVASTGISAIGAADVPPAGAMADPKERATAVPIGRVAADSVSGGTSGSIERDTVARAPSINPKPHHRNDLSTTQDGTKSGPSGTHVANIAADLPSRVEETLSACPQFRILVAGKTGIGKSSLISSVFNIGLKDIDIAHDRAGRADITHGYTSPENPRFILHDSQGFEPGSTENWDAAEEFLRKRAPGSNLPPQDKVHAIWLCIETPRSGSRVEQTGDENLLSLARELKYTVVAVFTKYDILVNEHIRKARKSGVSPADVRRIAEKDAEEYFNTRIKSLREKGVACAKVSTESKYPHCMKTLQNLAEITRQSLHDVESDLWVPWAVAQQTSAKQKVDFSIREGFKKYWLDLGTSSVFQGQRFIDCVARIHDDILEVWNFHDPDKVLSGVDFRTKMVQLVSPLLNESEAETDEHDALSQYVDVMSLASAVGTTLAQFLGGAGIALFALKYLYGKYQKIPMTARYLGAYIVDLTLVLHELFITMLTKEPPRPVSWELVHDAFMRYKGTDSKVNHDRVCDLASRDVRLEEKVADLIRELLKMNKE